MENIFNIYCDESCHLQYDGENVMLLGAIWCPRSKVRELSGEIWRLQKMHNAMGELKWTKVSKSKMSYYLDIIKWFFDNEIINYRSVVVNNKRNLDHGEYNENSHDIFYYKITFSLLSKIMDPNKKYNIYLDIKDSKSKTRLKKLEDILCNNVYDFTHDMINHIQNVHSNEVKLIQLADFFTGALAYHFRGKNESRAKSIIVDEIRKQVLRYGYLLDESTPLKFSKFNLFLFEPKVRRENV